VGVKSNSKQTGAVKKKQEQQLTIFGLKHKSDWQISKKRESFYEKKTRGIIIHA